MPQPEPSLTRRIVQGAGWMVGMRFAMRGLGLVNIAVLVRLLAPEDFGLFAMAMVIVGLAEVFSTISVDEALIRHRDPGPDDYGTAWTLRLIIASLVGLGIAGGAFPVAQFYDEPRVIPVMLVLAGLPFVRACENIWVVEYRRDLKFHKDFQLQVIARFFGIVVGLVLAFALRSYWALVLAALVRAAMLVIVSYFLHPGRPRFTFACLDTYLGFSGWAVVRALSQALTERGDRLAIGWSAGAGIMGTYAVAGDIARLAGSELAGPLSRALQPGYAKIQKEPERLAGAFTVSFGLAVILTTSLCFGISATAANFVPVVLGQQWLASIPILQVLGLAAAGRLVTSTTFTPLLVTIGRYRELAYFRAGLAILLIVVLFGVTAQHGAIWIAWTVASVQALGVVVGVLIVQRYLVAIGWSALGILVRCLLTGAAMYLAVYGFSTLAFVTTLPAWQQLILQVLIGGVVYVATYFVLWNLFGRPAGPERFLLGYARRTLAFAK